MDNSLPAVNIMGVRIHNVTMQEALAHLSGMLSRGERGYVVTPNAEIVYLGRRDEAAREVLNGAALSVPDGIGVVRAASVYGTPVREKVAGVELAENLLPELVAQEKSLYILGAKPGVAERAAKNLTQKYPGLKIAGVHDGYFKEDAEVLPGIRESGAAVCFVCLGCPKQEFWMRKNLEASGCCLMLGVGGSVDIYAGEAQRAPKIFIRLGLEWFYRLLRQPSRIGRMMSLPKFLLLAMGDRITGKKWSDEK
ncbi:MAG: WecB/TagA/CpsF family glycosyltransferase [Clostridia bacterium]|nr:WecB/TagA/CpsF family glycosyltransferase [Clostridia bacterium]